MRRYWLTSGFLRYFFIYFIYSIFLDRFSKWLCVFRTVVPTPLHCCFLQLCGLSTIVISMVNSFAVLPYSQLGCAFSFLPRVGILCLCFCSCCIHYFPVTYLVFVLTVEALHAFCFGVALVMAPKGKRTNAGNFIVCYSCSVLLLTVSLLRCHIYRFSCVYIGMQMVYDM